MQIEKELHKREELSRRNIDVRKKNSVQHKHQVSEPL